MQQDLQTLRSMRCGGSCVSKCHGRSWPHTALCHADLGECWHVKTASIPSRKANFSCLCLTNVTSPAFFVEGRLESQQVNSCKRLICGEKSASYQVILQKKTKCPEHFKRLKQTTLVYAGFKCLSKPCIVFAVYYTCWEVRSPVILDTNAPVAMPRGFKRNNWNTKDIKGPCEHAWMQDKRHISGIPR